MFLVQNGGVSSLALAVQLIDGAAVSLKLLSKKSNSKG